MFQKDDFIIYGKNGVCKVEDITEMDLSGSGNERTYYVLSPKFVNGSKLYCPVDNKNVVMRKILTEPEARQLLKEIPKIDTIGIPNDRLREEEYKMALRSCDCRQWIKVIKTLYSRRDDRIAHGKKVTSTDERYLKMAEDYLYRELAVVFHKDQNEVKEYIGLDKGKMIV
ncbi:MAG: CarD family transcriptional regulator [Lachnospiraceae bacterium]|nr:CarD family transcriptional regulator [Lachnospiraceae bacterium]